MNTIQAWTGSTYTLGQRVARICSDHGREYGDIESFVSASIVTVRLDTGRLQTWYTDDLEHWPGRLAGEAP